MGHLPMIAIWLYLLYNEGRVIAANQDEERYVRSPRLFPDQRLLAQHVLQGGIEDYLHIKFKAVTSSSELYQEQETIVRDSARRVLEQLEPYCVSSRRIFRRAGRYEARHIQAGLSLWYEYHCPFAYGNRGGGGEDGFGIEQSIHQKGEGTLAAIEQLQLLEAQHFQSRQLRHGSVHDTDDDDEEKRFLGIEIVEPEYAVKSAVLEMEDEVIAAEISTQGLTSSSSNGLRGNLTNANTGRPSNPGRSTQQLSEFPDDRLRHLQTHYDAIDMRAAWEIISDNNAWVNAQDLTVNVIDSGFQVSHEDMGGE